MPPASFGVSGSQQQRRAVAWQADPSPNLFLQPTSNKPTWEDVEDPRWHACFQRQLTHAQRGQRGVLGHLRCKGGGSGRGL